MKIKKGFVLRKCGNSEIVVPLGENTEKYKNIMITLSGSSKLLWEKLETGADFEELVSAMLEAYEVERAVVEKDVEGFVEKLRAAGLLDE